MPRDVKDLAVAKLLAVNKLCWAETNNYIFIINSLVIILIKSLLFYPKRPHKIKNTFHNVPAQGDVLV